MKKERRKFGTIYYVGRRHGVKGTETVDVRSYRLGHGRCGETSKRIERDAN